MSLLLLFAGVPVTATTGGRRILVSRPRLDTRAIAKARQRRKEEDWLLGLISDDELVR